MARYSTLFRVLVIIGVFSLLASLYFNVNDFSFSNYHWLPENNVTYINKRYLDSEFNQGESLLIVVSLHQNYFQQSILDELKNIAKKFKKITNVSHINSPLHAKFILKDDDDGLHNISFKTALDDGLLTLEAYPQHLKNSPYWLKFISDSENIIVIQVVVSTDTDNAAPGFYDRVFTSISSILDQSQHFKDYGFAGEVELYYRTEQLSKKDITKLVPIAVLVLAIFLAIAYRSLSYTLITLLVTSCVMLLMLNVNQLLGYPFNVISASLPILVATIAMADSIHIVRRWQVNRAIFSQQVSIGNYRPILHRCWQETWQPCLFTSGTSAIGFGVFYISELIPLKNFGITAFISISLAYPLIMLITFALLYALCPGNSRPVSLLPDLKIHQYIAFIIDRKNKVVSVSIVLLVASIAAFAFAKYETSFLEVFFDEHSNTRKSFDLIDETLTGSGSLDVIFQSDAVDTFKDINIFTDLGKQVQSTQAIKEIQAVNSMLEPIEMVHRPLSNQNEDLPYTEDGLAQELLFLEFSRTDKATDVLSQFVDFDYTNTRISLSTKNMKSNEIKDLIQRLSTVFDQFSTDWILTGVNVYFYELNAYVISAQFFSMLITGLFIWGFFMMQLGIKLGSIGMLSSTVPIATTMGTQIALGIPFDFSTVLVASVCLGICIDDTIHYMHRLKTQDINNSLSIRLQRAGSDIWQPVLLTSSVLMLGFLVLLNSDLVVVNRFSALTSLAIFLSLLSTLFLLPALLHVLIQENNSHISRKKLPTQK